MLQQLKFLKDVVRSNNFKMSLKDRVTYSCGEKLGNVVTKAISIAHEHYAALQAGENTDNLLKNNLEELAETHSMQPLGSQPSFEIEMAIADSKLIRTMLRR